MSEGLLAAQARRVLVGDGAMGTQLAERGLPPGDCGTLFNVERPDEILAIHRRYLEAGADILLTNTFAGSRFSLGRHGLADRVDELNRAGASLARRALQARGPSGPAALDEAGRTADAFVLGDIGPTGELPQPYGPRSLEELEAVFAEQAAALAGAKGVGGEPAVDAIIVETMIAVEECAAAVRAAVTATDLPVVASMAFDYSAGRDGFFTAMGVSPAVMVSQVIEAGASAVAANCGTIDPVQMARLVAQLAGLTSAPIMAQPNAGRPELVGGRTHYRQTPEDFAAAGPALVSAGARIVGGCCGTTPDHIAALRAALRPGV